MLAVSGLNLYYQNSAPYTRPKKEKKKKYLGIHLAKYKQDLYVKNTKC